MLPGIQNRTRRGARRTTFRRGEERLPELLVSVGGGVISDLVKRVSLLLDLPNWCVATAPSVDAYSSGTSAMNVNGFHGSVPARASEVIVCDLEVMEKAPREMHLAGLGDLLAKFLAFLDWNLSRIVTGENYCRLMSDLALESARSASRPRAAWADPAEAARTLTDAALSSGFAMQALGGSRSAATAEHTMAHFWESAHSVGNERWDLHGILDRRGEPDHADAYRALYTPPADFARRGGAPAPVRRRAALAGFSGGRAPSIHGESERGNGGSQHDREELTRRLEAFSAARRRLQAVAPGMLDELASAVELLEGIGFPFSSPSWA